MYVSRDIIGVLESTNSSEMFTSLITYLCRHRSLK